MYNPKKKIVISNTELSEYLYSSLIDFGLVPKEEEIQLVADLVFDYLWQKGAMDLTIVGEEDDEPNTDGCGDFYYDSDDEEYGG